MKSLLAVFAVLSWLCLPALAGDPWQSIGSAMMAFPNQPSEPAFRSIEAKLAKVPLTGNADTDSHSDLLGAAFLAGGNEGHGWPLTGQDRISWKTREIRSGKGPLASFLRNDRQVDGNKFDMWWMSYLGSQNDRYLHKLLRWAGAPAPKDNPQKAALIKIASWSSMSNCKQIPAVRNFAGAHLKDPAYEKERTFLVACLLVSGGFDRPKQGHSDSHRGGYTS